MKEVGIFLIALVLPFLYWRGLFFLAARLFNKPFAREKTGLQIHHAHFGIVIIFLASLMIVFVGKNSYSLAVLGLGLGFVFDEFIPSLYMPGNRPIELTVYRNSLKKTSLLFLFFVILVLTLAAI